MSSAAILLAAAAIIVLPGLALRAVLAPTRTLHWSTAPALTVTAAGTLTTLYPLVGIAWTPWTALIGLIAGSLLLHAAMLLLDGRRRRGTFETWGAVAVPALGLVLAAVIHAAAALSVMGSIGRINNSYDAFFHTAAVAFMRQSGDASMLTGTAPLYSGVPHYYPTAFDALAALLPGEPIAATNALSIMLVPAGALTVLGLVDAVLPDRTRGIDRGIALLLAASTVLLQRSPDAMALALGLWPNLLGAVVLSAVLSTLVRMLRAWAGAGRRERARGAVELTLVGVGGAIAHPSVVFTLLVLALCGAAAVAVPGRAGRPSRSTSAVSGALLVLGALSFLALSVRLRHMDMTAPPPWGMPRFVLDVLADRPRLGVLPLEMWAIAPVLLVSGIGSVLAWRRRERVAMAASLAVPAVLGLMVLGATQAPVLRDLTNVWYGAPERVAPMLAPACAVLCAVAAEAVADRSRRGAVRGAARAGMVVLAVAAMAVTAMPSRTPAMADLFTSPHHDRYIAYVTPEEQQFIDRAAQRLPDDAVVLGDPLDGTPVFWTDGGVEVVYPSLVVPGALDTRRVGLYGDEVHQDPEVCASMRRLGVTHLYRDTSPSSGAEIASRREERPWMGLHGIPVEELAVADQEGPYTLYAFDPPC